MVMIIIHDLVVIQLNRTNSTNPVQRMLKPTEFAVPIAKVPIHASPACRMVRVVRVGNGETAQHPELRLDQIEPRRFRGGPHRLDAESAQQGEERRMVVDIAQIIHDEVVSRVVWKKRSGAFFRLVKCTTSQPPWQAATGGTRHGQTYQEASSSARAGANLAG